MRRYFLYSVLAASLLTSCTQNAITGRSQLSFYSEDELRTAANTQYRQFLTESRVLSTGTSKDAEMVQRIGNRLVKAIEKYYAEKGLSQELQGYNWEYHLVQSDEVNAWCMPGGKIVVYTGILPITQNEAALAAVMGHEIAHALAKHSNERLSQSAIQQMGGQVVGVAVSTKSAAMQTAVNTLYGLGSQVGALLPFSRKQELEADKFGLIFCAMAGYNPQEAIGLWERMAQAGGGSVPEILSTHPAEATRIAKLKEMMPEALKYYQPVSSN